MHDSGTLSVGHGFTQQAYVRYPAEALTSHLATRPYRPSSDLLTYHLLCLTVKIIF